MTLKSVWLAGLLVFGAGAVNAQQYWSTNSSLDCGASYSTDGNGTPLKLSNGGYVCLAVGTLPWYAAGNMWGSSIRVSAPHSAPVAYYLDFYDKDGNAATLDFLYQGDSASSSDVTASSALYADQPLQVDIYGLHSQAPNYGSEADGSVVVTVYCPDLATCQQAQAQLIYSALPSEPWSLSVPVVWDIQTSLAWSAVGVDDSKTNTDSATKNTVSFAIYNLGITSSDTPYTYTLNVYDASGALSGQAVTPSIPRYGTYAALLSDLVPDLPSGPFKLQIVSPNSDAWTAFEVLQFHGPSATTLVSAWENLPTVTSTSATSSAFNRSRRLSPAARQMARPRAAR
jgi:hypothetical protein